MGAFPPLPAEDGFFPFLHVHDGLIAEHFEGVSAAISEVGGIGDHKPFGVYPLRLGVIRGGEVVIVFPCEGSTEGDTGGGEG